MKVVLLIFNLLGGLAVFLFGMKLMSDGLQKMAGVKLRSLLSAATTNRFTATLSGLLMTAIIQSSSATTVMVVGFTSAGLLTLYQALGVIFGANIGTTLTAWVVSLFGFKLQISLFALPVVALGFFSQFLPTKWTAMRRLGEAAIGFGLLFLGLDLMKNTIPADLASSSLITQWISKFTPDTVLHLIILILTGSILTVVLQSSSAVMALTLTCAAAGIINFPTACALVLGENLGTTITANLAAIGASKNARRAAIGHFLFNFIGVIWVSLIFHHFISLINWLVPGDPYVTDPAAMTSVLPYHISAFHTVFNVLNTLLMLPLLKQLAALTLVVIPKTKREDKNQDAELIYLNTHLNQTPELAILAARQEVQRLAGFAVKQTEKLLHALKTDDEKLFTRLVEDTLEYERTTDVLEHKINSYLTQMTHGNLSRHAVSQVVCLFELTSSLESITDCGEKIAKVLTKCRFVSKADFTTQDLAHLQDIAQLTKDMLKHCRQSIGYFPNLTPQTRPQALDLIQQVAQEETQLNTLRATLREQHNMRFSEGGNVTAANITAYSDILNGFERMGDYALRITETCITHKKDISH